jgi:hypothetical protein
MILGVDMIGVCIRWLIESRWWILILLVMSKEDVPVDERDTIAGCSTVDDGEVEWAVKDCGGR